MTKRTHGCKAMKQQLEPTCDPHPDPYDCVDRLVVYYPQFDQYGVIIHDGGRSYSAIRCCPWCGKQLPNSKRDRWFKVLASKGYRNPLTSYRRKLCMRG